MSAGAGTASRSARARRSVTIACSPARLGPASGPWMPATATCGVASRCGAAARAAAGDGAGAAAGIGAGAAAGEGGGAGAGEEIGAGEGGGGLGAGSTEACGGELGAAAGGAGEGDGAGEAFDAAGAVDGGLLDGAAGVRRRGAATT